MILNLIHLRKHALILSFCTMILAPSCGLLVGRGTTISPDQLYPATSVDLLAIGAAVASKSNPEEIPSRLAFFSLGLIDLPFALVVDTVLIPYDLHQLNKDKNNVEPTIGVANP